MCNLSDVINIDRLIPDKVCVCYYNYCQKIETLHIRNCINSSDFYIFLSPVKELTPDQKGPYSNRGLFFIIANDFFKNGFIFCPVSSARAFRMQPWPSVLSRFAWRNSRLNFSGYLEQAYFQKSKEAFD